MCIRDRFGIVNIGLCIILFTLVTKLLMIPLTIKQQKSSKLMAVMQPELTAIQKKYKGKEGDQKAMMMMQTETKACLLYTSLAGHDHLDIVVMVF